MYQSMINSFGFCRKNELHVLLYSIQLDIDFKICCFFYFIDARNAGLREHFNVTERTLNKIQSSIYSPILTKEINTLKSQLQNLKKDEEEL